jgi:hypothetical protein
MSDKRTELSDADHQSILQKGGRRFPTESYRQLRAGGASRAEVLQMLGFREDEVPHDVLDQG